MAGRGGRTLSRVLAVVLVVALLAGLFVFDRTELKLRPEETGSELGAYAARRLLEESEYAKAGRLERMRMYAQSLLGGKDSPEECLRAAQIALASGEYQQALDLTATAFDGVQDTAAQARIALQYGYICVLLGRNDDALQSIESAAQLTGDAEAYLMLALLMGADGAEELEEYIARTGAGRLDPAAGDIALLTGDYALIEKVYTRLQKESPDKDNLLFSGYGAYGLGQSDRAVGYFKDYIAQGGTEGAAWELCGLVAYRVKDYAAALEYFEAAREKGNADVKGCLYYEALCRAFTGDYAGALETAGAYETCEQTEVGGTLRVTLPRDEAALLKEKGVAYARLEDYEQAEVCFDKCLEMQPENGDVRRAAMSVKLYLEKWEDVLSGAEALNELDASDRYMRGVALYRLGRTGEARGDFEYVIDAEADDAMKEECRGYLNEINNTTPEETK